MSEPILRKPKKRKRGGDSVRKGEHVLNQQLLDIAEGILLEGKTWSVCSLCRQLRISSRVYYMWRDKYPIFKEVIDRAIKVRDAECVEKVENALLKAALGHTYRERTWEPGKGADPKTGKPKMVMVKDVRRRVIGNVKAQQFFLRNRDPERWPDKHEIQGNLTLEDRLLKLAQKRDGDTSASDAGGQDQ